MRNAVVAHIPRTSPVTKSDLAFGSEGRSNQQEVTGYDRSASQLKVSVRSTDEEIAIRGVLA